MLEHRFVAKGPQTRRLRGEARRPREELLERLARFVQPSELTEGTGQAAPSKRIVRAALYAKLATSAAFS